MKVMIATEPDEQKEQVLTLSLERRGDIVVLCGDDGVDKKNLLDFNPNGTVVALSAAKLHHTALQFGKAGRLIIT